MNPAIIYRLVFTIILSISGLLVYLVVNKLILRRATGKVRMFSNYRSGHPAIVYFTTPTCAPCKTVQKPAIETLKKQHRGDLQVIEVDAASQPEIAREWGVLSVPTTFVIDTGGNPRHVNHGLATVDKLNSQLEDFEI